MVDAWGRDGLDDDPLAKLERLVSARSDRMTGRGPGGEAEPVAAPSARPPSTAAPSSLRGAIDELYGTPQRTSARLTEPPVTGPSPDPAAREPETFDSETPDFDSPVYDAISDLDRELERVLQDTAPRAIEPVADLDIPHLDVPQAEPHGEPTPVAAAELPPVDMPPVDQPPVDLPPPDMPPVDAPRSVRPSLATPLAHTAAPELPPRMPVELPPSLMALRGTLPDAPPLPDLPPLPDVAPTLRDDDPLPRFLRHASEPAPQHPEADDHAGFDAELDADLNDALDGAVASAMAAATAAVAATGTQRPSADRPAAIEPLAIPEPPAYEAPVEVPVAPIDFGDDFERDLVDELLQIEPPTGPVEPDPLVAPATAPGGDADEERPAPANDNGSRRRGAMVAAMLAGVAVVGGLAAFSLGGADAPTEVALIRADPAPAKVRPADPGGRTVPNQSNAVYERVAKVETARASATPATPAAPAATIVDKTEDVSALREPVVPATGGATGGTAPRSDSRLAAVDVSPRDTFAPRPVRTIRVGPDGTLATPATSDRSGDPLATVTPRIAEAALSTDAAADANPVLASLEGTPAPGTPTPIFRPANLTTATLARPVAALATSAVASAPAAQPTIAPGGYVVQIASVPSADAARRTYGQLAARFGSIIGGRGVDYQVAQIPGKGTYHRVRVPAASKADAASTCASLKSAGGSCFVTR